MKEKCFIPCSLSLRFFIYGLFTVLCQVIFLALSVSLALSHHSIEFVKYIYIPYLEYPLSSLTLVIGGALLLDYLNLKLSI